LSVWCRYEAKSTVVQDPVMAVLLRKQKNKSKKERTVADVDRVGEGSPGPDASPSRCGSLLPCHVLEDRLHSFVVLLLCSLASILKTNSNLQEDVRMDDESGTVPSFRGLTRALATYVHQKRRINRAQAFGLDESGSDADIELKAKAIHESERSHQHLLQRHDSTDAFVSDGAALPSDPRAAGTENLNAASQSPASAVDPAQLHELETKSTELVAKEQRLQEWEEALRRRADKLEALERRLREEPQHHMQSMVGILLRFLLHSLAAPSLSCACCRMACERTMMHLRNDLPLQLLLSKFVM